MVVTIHDLIFIRYPGYFPAVDRKVYMTKVKYACRVADIVIAICEQTKKDLIEILHVPEEKFVWHTRAVIQFFNTIGMSKLIK